MDVEERSGVIAELSARLDMDVVTIGRLLDAVCTMNLPADWLTDWADYPHAPGVIHWPWQPEGPFYHGGRGGLHPGRLLLPPTAQGIVGAPKRHLDYPLGGYRADRVYLTSDVELARMYAAINPTGLPDRGGDVYLVEPGPGMIEDDPDATRSGLSFCVRSARIVSVVATSIRRAPYIKAIDKQLAEQAKAEQPPKLRPFPLAPVPDAH